MNPCSTTVETSECTVPSIMYLHTSTSVGCSAAGRIQRMVGTLRAPESLGWCSLGTSLHPSARHPSPEGSLQWLQSIHSTGPLGATYWALAAGTRLLAGRAGRAPGRWAAAPQSAKPSQVERVEEAKDIANARCEQSPTSC